MNARIFVAVALLWSALAPSAAARLLGGGGQRGFTERVNVSSNGTQADRPSEVPWISADGRYVVFHSLATNLVPGDTNNTLDVFLRDRLEGTMTRMSLRADGGEGYFGSQVASVSAEGPLVCFNTGDDLLAGDTNGMVDIYVRNASTNELQIASLSSTGGLANGVSYPGVIAAGGRHVAFVSAATNLVLGDTNGVGDVFVRDLVAGTTERVSVGSNGQQAGWPGCAGPAISPDGRFVTFHSHSSTLVPGDTNNAGDYFLHDRVTRVTERVSVGTGGIQGNSHSSAATIDIAGASVSADGRFVAFQSMASNFVPNDTNGRHDVFLRDRWEDVTTLVSIGLGGGPGNEASSDPSLTPDGRFVSFTSTADDLIGGDTNGSSDVFVRDLWRGQTRRVSLAWDGSQAGGGKWASLSADGLHIAFESPLDDLVPGDTNGVPDIFARSEPPPPPTAYCTAQTNSQGCTPAISSNGSPSASQGSGFWIEATNVLNQRSGLLFYGFGSATIALQGGTLCVAPPLRRTAVQGSGGNPPPADCSGTFAFDFNAQIASGADPALVAGRRVDAQYWSRDPQAPSGTNLTDAIELWICP